MADMGHGEKLLLIDGMAVLYRSFYAIPNLTAPDGRPSNALFGFVRQVEQWARDYRVTHWGVVFDGGLPERRTRALPSYKAQRPPMPESLRGQLPAVDSFIAARGIGRLRVEGEEADDVLASLAVQCGAGEVLIATNDKDLYQVVDARIQILPPGGKHGLVGASEIREKTGVLPPQVADWLALVGDTVDNIDGVPGIGGKTAAALLAEFGDIDRLYAGIDQVARERVRAQLTAARDTVARNRGIVRLATDLPLATDWRDWVLRQPDAGCLLPFYRQWGFTSLVKELSAPPELPWGT